jgi:alpha-tubulin suppressor-like RCC1 family protein
VRIGTDLDWLTVSVGDSHTCGVKAGTEVWCWGNNAKGELGSSTAPASASNVPVKVVG